MPTLVLQALICAVLAAGLAWAASGWLGRLLTEPSRWTAGRTHVVLAALGGLAAGLRGGSAGETIALVGTAVGLALLITVDLAEHRLPDALTAATAGWLALCWLICCFAGDPWVHLGRALLASAVLGAGFLLLALITPGGIGLGDAKLAAVLGLLLGWFGWPQVLVGVLGAFLLGGLFAVALLLTRRASGRTAIAFGPWLVAGAVLSLGWAPALLG